MAAFQSFDVLAEDLATGIHDFGNDQLAFFLTTEANAPDGTEASLSDLTVLDLTNLVGDNLLTTTNSESTAGVYQLTVADKALEASGGNIGPFRVVGVYNDTEATDRLVCYYTLDDDVSITDGSTLTLDFNQTTGLFRINPPA